MTEGPTAGYTVGPFSFCRGYEVIKKANASLSALADGQGVFFLDVGDRLIEKDGSLSKELFPDRLHIAAKA